MELNRLQLSDLVLIPRPELLSIMVNGRLFMHTMCLSAPRPDSYKTCAGSVFHWNKWNLTTTAVYMALNWVVQPNYGCEKHSLVILVSSGLRNSLRRDRTEIQRQRSRDRAAILSINTSGCPRCCFFLTWSVCMGSCFNIFERVIVMCLLRFAVFPGNIHFLWLYRAASSWLPASTASQSRELCFPPAFRLDRL